MITPSVFSFQLYFMAFIFVFAIFLLSVALYVVHVYIIAIICITFVMFLAPLMVPMALFKQTKGYYDAWIKILISYTLQPVVVFAFLALMLTLFDNIYYGTCQFEQIGTDMTVKTLEKRSGPNGSRFYSSENAVETKKRIPYYKMKNLKDIPEEDQQSCKDSFGYKLSALGKDSQETVDAFFFDVNIFKTEYYSDIANMLISLLTLSLFAFLFYYFVEQLSNIAADLSGSGGPIGRMAIGPKKLLDAVIDAVCKAIDYSTGTKAASQAKEKLDENAREAAGSEKEEGAKDDSPMDKLGDAAGKDGGGGGGGAPA
jgi:type IV secretion system protein VirB6